MNAPTYEWKYFDFANQLGLAATWEVDDKRIRQGTREKVTWDPDYGRAEPPEIILRKMKARLNSWFAARYKK